MDLAILHAIQTFAAIVGINENVLAPHVSRNKLTEGSVYQWLESHPAVAVKDAASKRKK